MWPMNIETGYQILKTGKSEMFENTFISSFSKTVNFQGTQELDSSEISEEDCLFLKNALGADFNPNMSYI